MAKHITKPSSILIELAKSIQETQRHLNNAKAGVLVVKNQEDKTEELLNVKIERLLKFISETHYKL